MNTENYTMKKEFQVIGISSDLENELSIKCIKIDKKIQVVDK